jgi:hypothetical protein
VHPTTPEKGQNSAPKPSKRPLKKGHFSAGRSGKKV